MFILWKWIGADGGKNQGGVRGRSDGKQCRDKFHGIYADGFGKCSMFPLCGCFFPFSDGLFLAGFSRKRIRVSWLYGFGTAGMALTMIRCVLSVIKDGWDWKKSVLQITVWLLGMLPGIFLFWMERQTKGAVGLGDGCFFLITGCYLGGWRTLELLMGAVFVSSLAGGVWMLTALLGGKGNGLWEKIRKKKLPFLPCVLPVWIWMLIASLG